MSVWRDGAGNFCADVKLQEMHMQYVHLKGTENVKFAVGSPGNWGSLWNVERPERFGPVPITSLSAWKRWVENAAK